MHHFNPVRFLGERLRARAPIRRSAALGLAVREEKGEAQKGSGQGKPHAHADGESRGCHGAPGQSYRETPNRECHFTAYSTGDTIAKTQGGANPTNARPRGAPED